MDTTTQQQRSKRGGKLDLDDMERRLIEFRLILDRERRRCAQANRLSAYSKLLRDRLDQDANGQPPGSEHSVKLDSLDGDAFARLAAFLLDTIGLCTQLEQHEQFQNVLRNTLQTARRRLFESARQLADDQQARRALEPFCLFCGTEPDPKCAGCRGSRVCIGAPQLPAASEQNGEHQAQGRPLPQQAGLNGHNMTNGTGGPTDTVLANGGVSPLPIQAAAPGASAAARVVATPPPSNSQTPDLVEMQQRQQREMSIHNLRNQFNESLNRSYAELAKQAGGQQETSTTPPVSPTRAQRFRAQDEQRKKSQQQQSNGQAATIGSQQQVSTTTNPSQPSQTTGAHQPEPNASTYQPRLAPAGGGGGSSSNTHTDQVVPGTDDDDDEEDAFFRHRADSVRDILERIDEIGPLAEGPRAAGQRPKSGPRLESPDDSDGSQRDDGRTNLSSTPLRGQLHIDESYRASPVQSPAFSAIAKKHKMLKVSEGEVVTTFTKKLELKGVKQQLQPVAGPPRARLAAATRGEVASPSTSQLEEITSRLRASQRKGARTKHQPKRRQ